MSKGSQLPVTLFQELGCLWSLVSVSTHIHMHTPTHRHKYLSFYITHIHRKRRRGSEEREGKRRKERGGQSRERRGEKERKQASNWVLKSLFSKPLSPLDHLVLALQLYSSASNLTSATLSWHQNWQLIFIYFTALEKNLDPWSKATTIVPHIYNFTFLGGWRAEFKTDLN